ncbi:probable peroxisomal membrane protein PEX13 [Venturia canescens]|uniref:probable peroxisomal membrane protein PEX13 n=1 Tax=Venturia canescens TaxID=32260 RepID=UPI001C9D5BE1|nr:probable peroxisomal membrane protein PEX13 [Venturia canescens]
MNVTNQQRPSGESFNQFRNGPSIVSGGAGTPFEATTGPPPPLPPRILQHNRNYPSYNMGYGNMFNNYGYGNTWNYRNSGLGSYSPYGYGGGYSPMYTSGFNGSGYGNQLGGPSGDIEDRFIQFAEESSRSAFQSIESVVRTFSSISMLLESTHFAISNSFRAILSVAENIGRTRNMFSEVMSAFAFVRFFKWLYRKVTYMIGLNPDDPNTEQVWKKTAADFINRGEPNTSTWPIVLFLSLLVAIPYLLTKFMNNIQKPTTDGEDPRQWFRYNEPVYSAVVLYDFDAVNRTEMSIRSGQKVWLAPQALQPKDLPGWSRASDNRGGVGLIPSNYIKIVGQLEKKSEESIDARAPSSPLTTHSILEPSISSSKVSEPSEAYDQKIFDESKES